MCSIKRTEGRPGRDPQRQARDPRVPRGHAFRSGHGHPTRCRLSPSGQPTWRYAFVAADGAAGTAQHRPFTEVDNIAHPACRSAFTNNLFWIFISAFPEFRKHGGLRPSLSLNDGTLEPLNELDSVTF